MIKKILVPVDGSQYSDRALDYAIDLAKKYTSNISLIHIVSTKGFVTSMEGLGPKLIADMSGQLEELGRNILTSAQAKVEKAGVEVSIRLERGNPADKIVFVAEQEKSDLIVLGNRGLGAVARFLLGSVSNNVIQHATCPVLVVK